MSLYLMKKRIAASSCNNGYDSTWEPLAKLARCEDNTAIEMTNASQNEDRSIFMLNEDCWRVLFSYVSVRDIINSERVSKEWYYRMQCYWQGVRVCLRSSVFPHRYDNFKPADPKIICRSLAIRPQHYRAVVKRFGNSIVAADCVNVETLNLLREFCPNLQELKVENYDYQTGRISNFYKLTRISFGMVDCSTAPKLADYRISRFIHCKTLVELEILNNKSMTGACLQVLQAKLKSLRLESCENLHCKYLLTFLHRLSELTELKLNHNSIETLAIVFIMIDKTPKLEYLGLERYSHLRNKAGNFIISVKKERYDFTTGRKRLVDAICRQGQLRHLSLFGNDYVTDDWLVAFGRSCKQLRAVSVGACKGVTAQGVLALCRGAGGTLAALDVSCNDLITDDDVVRCINYCPELEMLDVQFCSRLTEFLAARAAEAVRTRARPCGCRRLRPRAGPCACLRPVLRIHMPHWLRTHVTYDDLILDFSASNSKCQGY